MEKQFSYQAQKPDVSHSEGSGDDMLGELSTVSYHGTDAATLLSIEPTVPEVGDDIRDIFEYASSSEEPSSHSCLARDVLPQGRILRRSLSAPQLMDSSFFEWIDRGDEIQIPKPSDMRISTGNSNTIDGIDSLVKEYSRLSIDDISQTTNQARSYFQTAATVTQDGLLRSRGLTTDGLSNLIPAAVGAAAGIVAVTASLATWHLTRKTLRDKAQADIHLEDLSSQHSERMQNICAREADLETRENALAAKASAYGNVYYENGQVSLYTYTSEGEWENAGLPIQPTDFGLCSVCQGNLDHSHYRGSGNAFWNGNSHDIIHEPYRQNQGLREAEGTLRRRIEAVSKREDAISQREIQQSEAEIKQTEDVKNRALTEMRSRWSLVMQEIRLVGQESEFKAARHSFRKIARPLEVAKVMKKRCEAEMRVHGEQNEVTVAELQKQEKSLDEQRLRDLEERENVLKLKQDFEVRCEELETLFQEFDKKTAIVKLDIEREIQRLSKRGERFDLAELEIRKIRVEEEARREAMDERELALKTREARLLFQRAKVREREGKCQLLEVQIREMLEGIEAKDLKSVTD